MKHTVVFAGLVMLVLSGASARGAEDFTGKWSGSFVTVGSDGTTRDSTILMDLKQKGNELTGTAGPNVEQQWPLSKGVVDGNILTFDV